jgi:hypothetical protein
MAGAAGVMDRTNISRANFHQNGYVEISPTVNSVTLRYPVTAVDGLLESLFPNLTTTQLQVSFRDPGAFAVVEAVLLEQDPASPTAAAIPLLDFTSDAYAGSNDFQVQRIVACGDEAFDFDFVNRVYFVEVGLRRVGDVPLPALASLRLARVPGCLALD